MECGDIDCQDCKHYLYCAKGLVVYVAELKDKQIVDLESTRKINIRRKYD